MQSKADFTGISHRERMSHPVALWNKRHVFHSKIQTKKKKEKKKEAARLHYLVVSPQDTKYQDWCETLKHFCRAGFTKIGFALIFR